MKTDYKENEHKREVKDMLKISDYTNTVREEIEGSSGLKKMIQRNLDKMNEVIGDIDMSEKQKKTWLWLAGYEESTIDNILDVIKQKTGQLFPAESLSCFLWHATALCT